MNAGLTNAPNYWAALMKKVFSKKTATELQKQYPKQWKKEWTTQPWEEIASTANDDIIIHTDHNENNHINAVWRVIAALKYADIKISTQQNTIAKTSINTLPTATSTPLLLILLHKAIVLFRKRILLKRYLILIKRILLKRYLLLIKRFQIPLTIQIPTQIQFHLSSKS